MRIRSKQRYVNTFPTFKIARRNATIFLKEGAHDVKWGQLIRTD
jgi:hypothetical protein